MKRRLKTVSSWGIILLLLFMLAGCGQGGEDPAKSETVECTVELYFMNNEYMQAGDESLERYLTENRKVNISEDENQWLAILNELKIVDNEQMNTAIISGVLFEDVYVSEEDETIMVVDLESVGGSGGSSQEGFLIGQIVETIAGNSHLFEDSRNVDKVQFLVKGEQIESLMGHIDAREPFSSGFH